MVVVYGIQSITESVRYTGMALDVHQRLKEHNRGRNRFTKGHIPWKIVYTDSHPDWATARVKEKYLKSAAGKKWLEKQLAK